MNDPFSIDADQAGQAAYEPAARPQWTTCARCGERILNTHAPIEKFLGRERLCLICVRLSAGDNGQADAATRAHGQAQLDKLWAEPYRD